MSLEKAIEALTAAVQANTDAILNSGKPAAPAEAPQPERTRARPAAAAAPAAAKPAAPAPVKGPDKAAVIAKLTELCNIEGGRAACTELCVKHGSATKNASGLSPSVYAAVIADAQALIDAAADPAA